jgi:hypothetical protein
MILKSSKVVLSLIVGCSISLNSCRTSEGTRTTTESGSSQPPGKTQPSGKINALALNPAPGGGPSMPSPSPNPNPNPGPPTGSAACWVMTTECINKCGAKPTCPDVDRSLLNPCELEDKLLCALDKLGPWEDCLITCNRQCSSCYSELDPSAPLNVMCDERTGITKHSDVVDNARQEIDAVKNACFDKWIKDFNVDLCAGGCRVGTLKTTDIQYQCKLKPDVGPSFSMDYQFFGKVGWDTPEGTWYRATCNATAHCYFARVATQTCDLDCVNSSCSHCDALKYDLTVVNKEVSALVPKGSNLFVIADALGAECYKQTSTDSIRAKCVKALTNPPDPTIVQEPTKTASCKSCEVTPTPSATPTPDADTLP